VTLLLFNIVDFCLIAPLVEESVKLLLLRRALRLSNPAQQQTLHAPLKDIRKREDSGGAASSLSQQDIQGPAQKSLRDRFVGINPMSSSVSSTVGLSSPSTIRTYIIQMMAIVAGLKSADNIRRILLYTAPMDR
jgi:hypothetical protein